MADQATSTTGTTGTGTTTATGETSTTGTTGDGTSTGQTTSTTTDSTTGTTTGGSATDTGTGAGAGTGTVDYKDRFEGQQKVNRDLERKLSEDRAELDTLRAEVAKLQGKESEYEAAREKQRVTDEAISAANQRILKAELRAAAKGKLTDPSDAFRFPEDVDLSSFEVGEDGEVDTAALERAIDNLIANKPYLAVQDGTRFQGSADAGNRNGTGPAQLTQTDLNGMSAEQIVEAKAKGQLDQLMGVRR